MVVWWRFGGASARLGCSFSSLDICLVVFVFLSSVASAYGLWCVLRFRSSFSSFFFSFFSPFFLLFFLFLVFFFFDYLYSLWFPSCFPCLALPGVWPSLVFGLVGPSWPLLVVVFVLSSIIWGSWWYSGVDGGRRLFAFGVWLVFLRWRGGGWHLFAFGFGVVGWLWSLLALVWGLHLFVDMVDGWRLFVLGVMGWWTAFFPPLVWGQHFFAGVVVAGVCSPLVLVD